MQPEVWVARVDCAEEVRNYLHIFLACMHAISAMLYNFAIAIVSEVETVLWISNELVCRPNFAIDLASRSIPP